jgi:hypothetical protein
MSSPDITAGTFEKAEWEKNSLEIYNFLDFTTI